MNSEKSSKSERDRGKHAARALDKPAVLLGTDQDRVSAAGAYAHEYSKLNRIAMLGRYNQSIRSAIKEYLWDRDIFIPPYQSEYKQQKPLIFNYEAYGQDVEKHYEELCNYYYLLGANKIGIAQFKDQNGFQVVNKRVGQYYSKHRLDPVWNSTKSKKFRAIMAKFLTEERWFEQFQPTHLVLTVPHKNGIWQGKQIYIRELIKAFRELRHERWWKTFIHGGLYCIEVKKNKENGYHIHLHVLCFQKLGLKDKRGNRIQNGVNYVRKKIVKAWKGIVGNDTNYDGVHYSSLYFHERDENGKLIFEENPFWMASDEDPELITDVFGNTVDPMEIQMNSPKKRYIRPGDDVELWIKGVMECLKYHFKPGVLEKTDRTFDIPLIIEILNHTKGERFMSKFGKLHNHPGLSLNGKQAADDIDADCLGDAEAAGDNLQNPFTQAHALPEEYTILFTGLENLDILHDPGGGWPQIRLKARSPVLFFETGTTIKEAFSQYASGKFTRAIKGLSIDQLPMEGNAHKWQKPEWLRVEEIANDKTQDECPF